MIALHKIIIPERIVEAIEQGEQLRLTKWRGEYTADLVDAGLRVTGPAIPQPDLQTALKFLNDILPSTMREIALMDSKPEA